MVVGLFHPAKVSNYCYRYEHSLLLGVLNRNCMNFITIFMIAIGLSMDSFSVSISSGIFMKQFRGWLVWKIAFILAAFQAGMTALGWGFGINFSDMIESIDHWIAFLLLSYLGSKMILESFKNEEEKSFNNLSTRTIATLGLATSIDALAVGVGMAFMNTPIVMTVLIIFLTTFVISVIGLLVGLRFGRIKWMNFEIVGGLILIGIGIKILVEHLFFN
jgi:Predicted membrane protein